MDCFDGSAVLLEHAMLELLGGVIVESSVQGLLVDLFQHFTEFFNVGLGLFIQGILIAIVGYSDRQESKQEAGEDATAWQHDGIEPLRG